MNVYRNVYCDANVCRCAKSSRKCVFCVKEVTGVTKQLKCAHVFAYAKGNEKFPHDAAHNLFGHVAYTSAFFLKDSI